MAGFLSRLFGGSKSEKDIKKISPRAQQINEFCSRYRSLSNEDLRARTDDFRQRIREHLAGSDQLIAERKAAAEQLSPSAITEKDAIYQEIDNLRKDRNRKIEEILDQLLPEAFAVVKEAARRFTENETLESAATDLDRKLSLTKDHIIIQGERSVFNNAWKAAGG
jgi:preprotein translocase subunit SecA